MATTVELGTPAEPQIEARRVVSVSGDRFVADFAYDAELVRAVKRIPRSHFFGPKKIWIVPPLPRSVDALLAFATANGFTTQQNTRDELRRIAGIFHAFGSDSTVALLQRSIYRSPTGDLLFSFEENHHLADAVVDEIGGVWDRQIHAFRLPKPVLPGAADAILAVAQEYQFFVEPPEQKELLLTASEPLYEDDMCYRPKYPIDRTIFLLLRRLPESRRNPIIQAASSIEPPY